MLIVLLTLQGNVFTFGLRGDGMLGIETGFSSAGTHVTDSVVFKVNKNTCL